ncbi:metallophosphoesterase [Sulfurimonas sp.]|uniref:UDP-2,3-diacylglucosamine diphosphatase n=1 Tax=Sulfurimonas sp. TaxID=2022749 RepID=UPI0025F8143B|nr:metallophosphoesterase [Sulfurimonas sp.]MDD5158240.1 metallophosphoesterase [Sulfurimonas sp.]
MSHNIEIKEGAFIVADVHYSQRRPEFLEFLKEIHSKKLQPSQLILMGDIFDALFGGVSYTKKANHEAIKLLNEISLNIEIIYLEGNHDFRLKNIFKNVKVFTISKQPLEVNYKNKKVLLAHGDIESPLGYRIYTWVIRNPVVLFILSFIDWMFGHLILKKLNSYLNKKEDCREFLNLEEFMMKRLVDKYSCDYFIEGHFHQNKTIKFKKFNYTNLAAFACNQRYFIVKSSQELELIEVIFSQKGV